MFTLIQRILAPPTFSDEEKNRITRLLHVFLLTILFATTLTALLPLVLYGFPTSFAESYTPLSAFMMTLATAILFILARRGHVLIVGAALSILVWTAITFWVFTVAGVSSDGSLLGYATATILAGVLLGGRGATVFAGLSMAAILVAYYAEANGLLVVVDKPLSILDPALALANLILSGIFLRHAMNSMTTAVERARENERAQLEANRKLNEIRATLEQRVLDRTWDLEHRNVQLQVATDVGRAAVSILEPERLTHQVTNLLQERFNLYHVALFQIDETGEWAQYIAGAGAGAQALLEEGLRLKVGSPSMIGLCTAHAQARVSGDVRQEAMRYEHPLVPDTRSEAAIPLIARGRVIGALSVQSTEYEAFDQNMVTALQIIADQVAVAIENARLFTESQAALEAAQRAYSESSREAWAQLIRARPDLGYLCNAQGNVRPVAGPWQPEMARAVQEDQAIQVEDLTVAIPIKIRDQVLGAVRLRKPEEAGQWTSEEMELVKTLTNQLNVALESARLYQGTQRRAIQEQLVGQVTARMRETLDIETVLKTAAQEVRQALGLPEVVIRLRGTPTATGYKGDGHQDEEVRS